MTDRGGQSAVARQQCCVEHLGQRDIDSILGCQVVPQLPDTRQKKIMRIPLQAKVNAIGKSRAAALAIDFASSRLPSDYLRNLDIQQMRRVQRSLGFEQAAFRNLGCRGAKEHFK